MEQLSQGLAPESVLLTTTRKVAERGKLRVEVGNPQIVGPFTYWLWDLDKYFISLGLFSQLWDGNTNPHPPDSLEEDLMKQPV